MENDKKEALKKLGGKEKINKIQIVVSNTDKSPLEINGNPSFCMTLNLRNLGIKNGDEFIEKLIETFSE